MERLLILLQKIFHQFKCKSKFFGNTNADGANRKKEGAKIVVPLKYLSKFWRYLEIPLINCKVEFSIKWYEECILSSSWTAANFKITDTKLYVPVVTLKTEDNTKLSEILSQGFKRPIYWNEDKVILNKNYNGNEYIRERLDANFQGFNRLFVFPYMRGDNLATENSHNKNFLPRLKTENYNVEIDHRNFYDQAINGSIKQYDEISIGQGGDYTTGCFLDFSYFKEKYRLIAADLRAIQQIVFTYKTRVDVIIYYTPENQKKQY